MLQCFDLKPIVTGRAITAFITEFRLAIIRRIVPTEEIALTHPVELHQIARHMGTHRIVGDTPLAHGLYSSLKLFTVGDIDHILSRLCSSIATFQPITVSTLFRRNGYADVLHDILQTTSGTTPDTLR